MPITWAGAEGGAQFAGVSGWAQVEYGYGATEEDALEKLKYDLYYIKNNNLFFDLWIVLKTVKVVVIGQGAR